MASFITCCFFISRMAATKRQTIEEEKIAARVWDWENRPRDQTIGWGRQVCQRRLNGDKAKLSEKNRCHHHHYHHCHFIIIIRQIVFSPVDIVNISDGTFKRASCSTKTDQNSLEKTHAHTHKIYPIETRAKKGGESSKKNGRTATTTMLTQHLCSPCKSKQFENIVLVVNHWLTNRTPTLIKKTTIYMNTHAHKRPFP